MSLGFLHPALAWGLLAAAIPILIHLFYRRRPRPTPFPAIDFILKARRETERRLRLKKLLLFAARTLLLAAIAAALARPQAQRPAEAAAAPKGPSAVAIVLDASASMGYRLGGRTLFERARAEALDALDGLTSDEPATVLVCGGPAEAAAPAPTFDRGAQRRALASAELTFGHADLTACTGAALRALENGSAGAALAKKLVVATDLTASAWRLDVPAPMVQTKEGAVRPEVTLLDAARGAALPNAAVTGLELEPDPSIGARGYRITASLASFGKEPLHDVPLQLRVGIGKEERTVLRAFADVPAGASAKKTLSHAFGAGGAAVVTLALPGDALAFDDARSATVEVPREVKALVVDGAPSPVKYRDEAFFVESALSSPASPVRPVVIDAEGLPRARFADYDVVFLLNVRALGAKAGELRSFVEGGGGLFIALGNEVDPDIYDSELDGLLPRALDVVKTAAERGAGNAAARAARFGEIAWEHPALAVFVGPAREGFEGVRTYRYMLLKPGERGRAPAREQTLVSYDDGAPALVEAARGKGRVILYTSTVDREWSDWTIRTSFLPAIQRLAAYLAGALEEHNDAPTLVFTPRKVAVREGQKLVALVAPDGKERSATSPSPRERAGVRGDAATPSPLSPRENAASPSPLSPRERVGVRGGTEVTGDTESPTFTPDRPGLWQVKVEEGGQTKLDPRLAFSVLPDPRESDTRRLDPSELTAYFGGATHAQVTGEKPPGSSEHDLPLWSILLALGVVAFFLEGLLIA